ncbi:S9 family peptidase [Candidatus Thorarchaeota archaeon]|nr:MAG: S9 family peptidase [Candidatus Thorarchaeota archaeon]
MDLFDKVKLILDTVGYQPFDIGNSKAVSTGPFLTPNNAMILHMNDLEKPNEHIPILAEDEFAIDARFSPDDSWLAVPIDYSGKEEHLLYRLSTKSQEIPLPKEQLSRTPGRYMWLEWSPDGRSIAWCVSRQDSNQLIVQPNKEGEDERVLWKGDEIVLWLDWGNTGLVKFTRLQGATNEFHETVIDPKDEKELVKLPVASSNSFFGRWHPRESVFPFLNADDHRLALYDVKSDEKILLPKMEGELEGTAWTSDGSHLLVSSTKDARDTVLSIDPESLEVVSLELPAGINKIVKVRQMDSEDVLFFVHADATTRVNLWKMGLESQEVEQLTKKRSPKVGTDDFPLVNSISEHWKSRDGLQIHGFVMVPDSPPPDGGYPAVVNVHGGPTGQDADAFVGTYQILVQEGFVVFRPNFRGSTGYGVEFQRANFREIGKADLIDIVTGVENLVKKYNVNPEKVAVMGGSYGGYMTLRALTKPDVFGFAAGWAEAAISDFRYLYETGDAVFREFISYLFGPPDDDETKSALAEASPISDWENLQSPLGVVQLANDTRTPLKPVWDFVNLLIERGDNVEFHVEPAMGHVNIPKGYLARSIVRKIQFLQKHLLES